MIIYMSPMATDQQLQAVITRIENMGASAHPAQGIGRMQIGAIGTLDSIQQDVLAEMAGVEQVRHTKEPYKLVSRDYHPHNTQFTIGNQQVGGDGIIVMAGPCAIESREQIIETAYAVKAAGATMLRGGAYKPRTSPYSFHGLGEDGLRYLREAGELTGLPTVSEVMEPELVPLVASYIDVLQIGARNMQNYALLHAVGKSHHPVLLKRGLSGTIEEWLCCAEYIMSHGNKRVMLCERGIRTYEQHTRNTFDVNAIPVLKQLTHLPIIADPSHATGKREYVPAVSNASVAAGADGLIVEVHLDPEHAISDGRQSMTPEAFGRMLPTLNRIAEAVDRSVSVSAEMSVA